MKSPLRGGVCRAFRVWATATARDLDAKRATATGTSFVGFFLFGLGLSQVVYTPVCKPYTLIPNAQNLNLNLNFQP